MISRRRRRAVLNNHAKAVLRLLRAASAPNARAPIRVIGNLDAARETRGAFTRAAELDVLNTLSKEGPVTVETQLMVIASCQASALQIWGIALSVASGKLGETVSEGICYNSGGPQLSPTQRLFRRERE